MKLIRQVRLHFQDERSDKIYEVDLCEVGSDQYVVNFRYGRRGANLRDGSKTALPVDEAQAGRIYDKLVASKVKKGYREVGAGPQRPAEPSPAAPPPPVEELPDPRHQRIAAYLRDPRGAWTSRSRLVFRAGELRVRAAGPLVQMLSGADHMVSWNVVRALLRAGDPVALPALARVWEVEQYPDHVRYLAGHGIRELSSGADRDRFLQSVEERIPEAVLAAYEAGRYEVLLPDLEEDELALLYLVDTPARRPHLLAVLGQVQFRPPWFRQIRRVFKAAEARGDGEVYGLLARRFELERPMHRGYGRYSRFGRGRPTTLAWSSGTRTWFRRRAWRTLRRLGEAGMADDYCGLATGLLLAFTDDDARQPRRRVQYSWRGQASVTHWGAWSHYWAFNQVLFRRSGRYQATQRSMSFRCRPGWQPGGPIPTDREEAFPELWDEAPRHLVELLRRSRCAPVHLFAARALQANRSAWGQLSTRELIELLESPYERTAELAATIAVTRYDPRDPDLELVLALASCDHDVARTMALTWIRDNPSPFLTDVSFLIGLVLNQRADTRRLALDVLAATTLASDSARALVDAVIDAARTTSADDEQATERLRDAAALLLTAFSQELRTLPLDLVTELVTHPAEGVAELGAKILLGHEVRPPELPDELLAGVMTSEHAVVRGIGVRLYGELPDAVLAERYRVLLDLITNRHTDVRSAVRPIVARLAGANPAFGRVVLGGLVKALAVDGPEGMHEDVVRLLRSELSDALRHLGTDAVLDLVSSPSTAVQQLGGELLRTQVDPSELTVSQVARLADSDILAVRRAAWHMLEAGVDEVRADPGQLLPLFDAEWQDTREFAFHYTDQVVGPEHLSPDLAVAVCDSIRPDVQAFGRRLVTRLFEAEHGPDYLLKLAQHPSTDMQMFASAWLEQHAAGHPERLEALVPFFLTVLSRVNQGRIAKERVLAFLAAEAARDQQSAVLVAGVLTTVAASVAVTYRAAAIQALVHIRARWPDVDLPLTVVEPEVRRAV